MAQVWKPGDPKPSIFDSVNMIRYRNFKKTLEPDFQRRRSNNDSIDSGGGGSAETRRGGETESPRGNPTPEPEQETTRPAADRPRRNVAVPLRSPAAGAMTESLKTMGTEGQTQATTNSGVNSGPDAQSFNSNRTNTDTKNLVIGFGGSEPLRIRVSPNHPYPHDEATGKQFVGDDAVPGTGVSFDKLNSDANLNVALSESRIDWARRNPDSFRNDRRAERSGQMLSSFLSASGFQTDDSSSAGLESQIKQFQEANGLEETGRLNYRTSDIIERQSEGLKKLKEAWKL